MPSQSTAEPRKLVKWSFGGGWSCFSLCKVEFVKGDSRQPLSREQAQGVFFCGYSRKTRCIYSLTWKLGNAPSLTDIRYSVFIRNIFSWWSRCFRLVHFLLFELTDVETVSHRSEWKEFNTFLGPLSRAGRSQPWQSPSGHSPVLHRHAATKAKFIGSMLLQWIRGSSMRKE